MTFFFIEYIVLLYNHDHNINNHMNLHDDYLKNYYNDEYRIFVMTIIR